VEIESHLEPGGAPSVMAEEVEEGLRSTPKNLPSKYFYDARGSELFEKITELPEYYPTRTEQALLERFADEITADPAPAELIELGSGSGKKTRLLIDAARSHGRLRRYTPFEVSEQIAEQSAQRMAALYPDLQVFVVVGDFELHLDEIPPCEARLVVFLGGTIGNFMRADAVRFLSGVASLLDDESRFLLGTDLVKDTAVLEAAYNDAQGVTAEFNLNILNVINHHLDADFDPAAFEHVALFNADLARIEMHLRSRADQRVRLRGIDLEVAFARGELMRTEVSHKYTRESVDSMLEEAGLKLERWFTDPDDNFALSLSSRR
jgi:L-histidine N-alpha-methyltransferase